MRKSVFLGVFALAVVLAGMAGIAGMAGMAAIARGPAQTVAKAGGLVTLYQHDPYAQSVSFGTGEYGSVCQDNMVKNRESDLMMGHYVENEFSVGIEGGRIGAIVDLGSSDELRARYGYEETVGGGQGFASLRMVNEKLSILSDYEAQTTQPVKGADALFSNLDSGAHAPIHRDHIYVVHLQDRHDPKFDRLVKFLVVQYEPGVSATLRWQVIPTMSNSSHAP